MNQRPHPRIDFKLLSAFQRQPQTHHITEMNLQRNPMLPLGWRSPTHAGSESCKHDVKCICKDSQAGSASTVPVLWPADSRSIPSWHRQVCAGCHGWWWWWMAGSWFREGGLKRARAGRNGRRSGQGKGDCRQWQKVMDDYSQVLFLLAGMQLVHHQSAWKQ